ncbi:MAG: DEAD/DEAH box helicase [Solirubrobacteraceae bacterium]
MITFKELGLSDNILKALEDIGFETPSEIQKQAIPELLSKDQDLIGLAQTGTGKTAAFGLPLLDKIDPTLQATQGLILAPTRELGKQIADQLEIFSKYQDKISTTAVYGGAAIVNQIRELKKTQHIIIATPGRLIDLINRKSVNLSKLRYLVLDEADEMLNMGFKDELEEILSHTPEGKNTWLFSATMPPEIKRIVKKYMDNPFEVKVGTQNQVNVNIEHVYSTIGHSNKTEALCRFIDLNEDMQGVVFCRTKRDTQSLAEALLKKNYKADALHGDLSQAQRDRVMGRFKNHDLNLLIATDVAARGIDVDNLSHVFHFSLPDDNAYYTHRSGRTARAGKQGISVVFVSNREVFRINRLERELNISFKQLPVPEVKDIIEKRMLNWSTTLITQKKSKSVSDKLLEKINENLLELTKEELIEKLVSSEISKLNIDSNSDLNDYSSKSRPSSSSDGFRGREGGNRGGNSYGGNGGGNFRRGDSSSDRPFRGGGGDRRDNSSSRPAFNDRFPSKNKFNETSYKSKNRPEEKGNNRQNSNDKNNNSFFDKPKND